MKDYYIILEVAETATQEEIVSAYKALIKRWHPDVNRQPEAVEKTKALNEAYAILSVAEKRQQYDFQRNPFGQTDGQPRGWRVTYTPSQNVVVNHIVIVRTPTGDQVWVNGVRQQ